MDAETRSLVRRSVSNARRQAVGAELDVDGITDMVGGSRNTSLPLAAWEASGGDSLLALDYALDFLKMKQAAATEAA